MNAKFATPEELLQTPENKELYNEFLMPNYLEPLKELGFNLEKYGHVGDENMGTHILVLSDETGLTPLTPPSEQEWKSTWEQMVQIATQNDDGQPHSTFRYHLGTLFIYIPYFA